MDNQKIDRAGLARIREEHGPEYSDQVFASALRALSARQGVPLEDAVCLAVTRDAAMMSKDGLPLMNVPGFAATIAAQIAKGMGAELAKLGIPNSAKAMRALQMSLTHNIETFVRDHAAWDYEPPK